MSGAGYVSYVRYDDATGEIVSMGTCPAANLDKQARPGKSVTPCDKDLRHAMMKAAEKGEPKPFKVDVTKETSVTIRDLPTDKDRKPRARQRAFRGVVTRVN